MVRLSLVLVSVATLAPSARAESPPPSVLVAATASSALPTYQPWNAIDANTSAKFGWCPAKGDGVGETLTFTFEAPVEVAGLDLVGHAGLAGGPTHMEITAGKQTVDVPKLSNGGFTRVALDGSSVSSITFKILAVDKGKVARTCFGGSRVLSTKKYYYSFVYGMDGAAMLALPAAVAALDRAFKACDATALAANVTFPIGYEDDYQGMMDQEVPPPKKATYHSAAELVKACKAEGNLLARGFAADMDDVEIAGAAEHGDTYDKPGTVRIGSESTNAWWLAAANGKWSLTKIEHGEMIGEAGDGGPKYAHVVAMMSDQIDALNDVNVAARAYTGDATVVVMRGAAAIVKPRDLGAIVGATKGHAESDSRAMLSRDGMSAWLSFSTKIGAATWRVSSLVVRTGGEDGGWKVKATMWSVGEGNAAVNAAAKAGKLAKLAPVTASGGDASLLAAFMALQTGTLDPVAAARKDLVAIGSGPGERSVGGKALAGPWSAGWSRHWTLAPGSTASAGTSPSGSTGWVVADVLLDKATYKIPFRLFFIFDRTGAGPWSLVHAHFAVPHPT